MVVPEASDSSRNGGNTNGGEHKPENLARGATEPPGPEVPSGRAIGRSGNAGGRGGGDRVVTAEKRNQRVGAPYTESRFRITMQEEGLITHTTCEGVVIPVASSAQVSLDA